MMNIPRKNVFVFNPSSFASRQSMAQVASEINAYFLDKRNTEYMICYSKYPRYPCELLRRIFEATPEETVVRVYAVGGDGILYDCLNGIMEFPNAELAAIPYGSTNNFIRSFGKKSFDSFRNIDLQVNAPVVSTDVMCFGNFYALNACYIGLSSASHQFVMRYSKYLRGYYRPLLNIATYIGAVKATADENLVHQKYEIIFDGVPHNGSFSNILITNGPRSGNNLSPIPQALPNDGDLDVLTSESASTLATLFMMSAYMRGKPHSLMRHYTAKNIVINSEDPMSVVLDGQIFKDKHLMISILPSAVKFAAASGFSYTSGGGGRQYEERGE